MKSYAFTTLVFFFCLWCSWCFVYGRALSEKYVLLDFKASLYDPHGLLSGWDTLNNTNHCSWPGVSCNPKSRVVSINIAGAVADGYQGNFRAFSCSKSLRFPFHELGGRRACSNRAGKLRGKLSPLIAKLSELRVLSLPFHQLSGEIPPDIWDLEGLRVLNLEGNLFSGKLPNSFVGLRRLRVLNLGFNMLDGDFPASLFRCVALEILNLSGNRLKGPIPGLFDSLVKLRGLYLANNELNGTVPSVLGSNCRHLEHLDLSGNSLTGKIPATFGNCRHLRTLLLFSNLLNDSIPHELGALRKLEVLDVSRNFINGAIPSELGNCAQMSILVLSSLFEPWPNKGKSSVAFSGVFNDEHNHFQGSIPMEVTTLPNLRVLWAQGASLEGKLPGNWGHCERLEMLNLAQNGFSGEINGVFEMCKKLYYLDLSPNKPSGDLDAKPPVPCMSFFDVDQNLVSGLIPRFDISFCPVAPSLNSENFTAVLLDNYNLSEQIQSGSSDVASLNELSGQVPLIRKALDFSSSVENPHLYEIRRVLLPASSSDQANGNDVASIDASSPSETKTGNHGFNAIEIASIASASAIVSVLVVLVLLFFYTRTLTPDARVQVVEPKEITFFVDLGVPLSYENIVQATENFNASNCIGNGGFGATYKAEISPGSLLAIKRLAVGRFQGVQQFDAEIKALGRVSHPNLVTLIGYHASEAEMFLIYNYLPGGNLEGFINERSSKTVDWKIFHKIALDVARALAYLHDQCNPRILHRDVKPSNILLDNDYNAYLSDFGLARLMGTSETHATTGVAGTFGYVAPEYAMTCRVSEKADVYSYGVVLLELISDKKALDPSFCAHENGFNIVSWACMLLRRGRAKEVFTARLWDSGPHDDMVEVLHLAVTCTVETLSTRPTMKQVVQRLKRLQPS